MMKKPRAADQNGIIDNLKKGVTEMLVLSFLEKQDMHIYAIIKNLDECSNGVCRIAYPYGAIYRLYNSGYIKENGKKVDDNRLRQLYTITESGRKYLKGMRADYATFIGGVDGIFESLDHWKERK